MNLENSRKRFLSANRFNGKFHWRLAIVVTLSLAFGMTANACGGELQITHNADGLAITEDGNPVLQYQLTPKGVDGKFVRSNYIHPLYDLNGAIITEDFPEDHLHHRGVFWAWHQVWVGDQKIGDPWLCKDFEWKTVATGSELNSDGTVTASATVQWQSSSLRSKGHPRPFVEERVEVRVFPRVDSVNNHSFRIVEFRLSFQALLANVRIGGSEDSKGYGGFSPRIKLSDNQTFVSDGKTVEPVKQAIHAGPWVDVSTAESGIAILTHPANPGFPEAWILRRQRSMQNARFPGRTPVAISTEKSLVQRYQLIIHGGTTDTGLLDRLQSEFAQRP